MKTENALQDTAERYRKMERRNTGSRLRPRQRLGSSIRAGQFTTQAGHLIEKSRSRMIDENGSIGKPDDMTVLCFRQSNRSR